MDEIDLDETAEKYNKLKEIWSNRDYWHLKTHVEIAKFIQQISLSESDSSNYRILNAGSGGNSYGLPEKKMLHVDIAKEKIQNKEQFLVANIENLPLPDEIFDMAICVGSVINYCDPMKAIQEFDRLLKNNALLVIEFENSISWEFFGTNKFNKQATIITTFYNCTQEKLWVFSEKYISNLLKMNHFSILKLRRFHLLSPLFYKMIKNENVASRFIHLDKIVNLIPGIRRLSSNVIIYAKKA